MRHLTTRLGSLTTHVIHADSPEVPPELAVVLCHGYGAPGGDLVGLGPELLKRHPALQGRVRFYFPEAPLSLGSYGLMDGRAWWHLDMERLMAIQQGDLSGMERYEEQTPEGLAEARRALTGALDELCRGTGLPFGRLVLGGFSQGAMLTTDVTLRLDEPPAALALFSGALISRKEWESRAPRRKGLRVLQSHGTQDPILPYESAERLRGLLETAGLSVEFIPFHGPHTIAAPALERLGELLLTALSR